MFGLTQKKTEAIELYQPVDRVRSDIPDNVADLRFCVFSMEYTECKGNESIGKLTGILGSIGEFARVVLVPAIVLLAIGLSVAEVANPGAIAQFHDVFWKVVG